MNEGIRERLFSSVTAAARLRHTSVSEERA
jgi:hypothetical protein